MKKTHFAYLSLFTSIFSGIIYWLSQNMLLSLIYLWPFHILAMASFGSMIVYKLKENRIDKNSDPDIFKKSLFILKKRPVLLLMNMISGIILLVLFQNTTNNFIIGIENKDSIVNPINQFSGLWLLFSLIPTVYYFLFERLENDYRNG